MSRPTPPPGFSGTPSQPSDGSARLNRYLAACGLGSRRAVEALILAGRVTVDGAVTENLATRVPPGSLVKVDARTVQPSAPRTILLHKPPGYICSRKVESGFRSVYDLLPPDLHALNYVGRLDAESEGALILTNDGNLAQRLTRPGSSIPKTYVVTLDRPFNFEEGLRLRKGMEVEGKPARFDAIHALGGKTVRVVLTQGLKRQIRVMFSYLGYEVKRLLREAIGGLELARQRRGAWRQLDDKEIELACRPRFLETRRPPTPSSPREETSPSHRLKPFSPAHKSQKLGARPSAPFRQDRSNRSDRSGGHGSFARRDPSDRHHPRSERPSFPRPARRDDARPSPTWRDAWSEGDGSPVAEGRFKPAARPPRREGFSSKPSNRRPSETGRSFQKPHASRPPFRSKNRGDSRPPSGRNSFSKDRRGPR